MSPWLDPQQPVGKLFTFAKPEANYFEYMTARTCIPTVLQNVALEVLLKSLEW